MTSGQFHSVEIGLILVNREGRQRHELPDISDLSDSINRLGLIHPIVITRENVLVAGERRLAACSALGHTHISCQYTDELEEPRLHEIELEENIKRSNLTWQEECKAIFDYHNLRKSEEPSWTQEDTGNALGIPQQTIADKIVVAKELVAGNERVLAAPKYSTAKGITDRTSARKDEEALNQLRAVAKIAKPLKGEEIESVINTNFLEWAPTYDGPRFNFVHCDFPYGIHADKFNQGAAFTHGGYDDTEQTYWSLCSALVSNLDRLTTESCHFMFWFSMHYYHDTLSYFAEHSDIIFDSFPLVWLKSDNVGILPDPSRGPRRIYETALFGSRGDRKIVASVSNAYSAPTDRTQHMSIKPEPVLRNFFRMFVDESTLILDPTCGSGSSLRAAESLNARYVLGVELNKEYADGASRALKSSRLLRRKTDVKGYIQPKIEAIEAPADKAKD
jgi:ParB family transcriptional regulator, chromosome partitioning protein